MAYAAASCGDEDVKNKGKAKVINKIRTICSISWAIAVSSNLAIVSFAEISLSLLLKKNIATVVNINKGLEK